MPPQLPDPIERRHLLSADPTKKPVDHAGLADRYLGNGRKSDALDFGEKSSDAASKAAIRTKVVAEAVQLGDFFLLNRVDLVSPLDEGTWRKAFASAKTQGKLRYALKIAKKLGDTAEVAALEAILKPPGWAPPPPEVVATAEIPGAPVADPAVPPAPGVDPSKDGGAV